MKESNRAPSSIWTPANIVTLVRICLVPVFVVALLSPWPSWFGIGDVISDEAKAFVAAGVFIVISCTDWIDGYLARSRGEVTDFGKFLDPLADKILVAAALIALVELQTIPAWPVLIILTREFIVSGIRMIAAVKGVVIAASWYGKAKTVLQIAAIVLFIVKDAIRISYGGSAVSSPSDPLYMVSWLVMIAALIVTIVSMLDYIAKARPLLFPKDDMAENDGKEDVSTGSGQHDPDNPAASTALFGKVDSLACELVDVALTKNVRMATAESLTGGLIASAITAVPGSSGMFNGAAVTYVNEAKHHLLHVGERLLTSEGAVSSACAKEMAAGACKELNAQIAVSVTGIAGPGGAEPGKPVGTVFVGLCIDGESSASEWHFEGSRLEIRMKTVEIALKTALRALENA